MESNGHGIADESRTLLVAILQQAIDDLAHADRRGDEAIAWFKSPSPHETGVVAICDALDLDLARVRASAAVRWEATMNGAETIARQFTCRRCGKEFTAQRSPHGGHPPSYCEPCRAPSGKPSKAKTNSDGKVAQLPAVRDAKPAVATVHAAPLKAASLDTAGARLLTLLRAEHDELGVVLAYLERRFGGAAEA